MFGVYGACRVSVSTRVLLRDEEVRLFEDSLLMNDRTNGCSERSYEPPDVFNLSGHINMQACRCGLELKEIRVL